MSALEVMAFMLVAPWFIISAAACIAVILKAWGVN